MAGEPFRFSVRTFRVPGWVTPLLVLLALAMIPVAMALALGLLALVLGAGLVRALFPPAGSSLPREEGPPGREVSGSLDGEVPPGDGPVIDVEYEARDEEEKS